ncbi:solute carrier family 2, facilitated glucose transporter member 1-like [Glandiceps talaboti]
MAKAKIFKKMPQTKQKEAREVKVTFMLVYATIVVSFTGNGLSGYSVGVLAAPTKTIQDFYNQSYTERYGEMAETTMDLLWATTAASFAIGGAIGALLAPPISVVMGRKFGLLLINVFAISGALMYGASKSANNFELVIMGRIVIGFYCGILRTIATLFLSEISPDKYRGAVGCNQKLFFAIGIVIAQVLGIFVLNTDDTWHYLLAITGLFSVLHLILFPPCPDSPRWLLITDYNPAAAKKALKKYYGASDVNWAVEEIVHEHKQELKEKHVGLIGLFANPSYRLPLLISVTVMSSVHFCGIPAMYQYAGFLFEMVWPNNQDAINFAILGMGLAELSASVINIFIIDRVGRRPLLLYTCATMVFFNGLITLSLVLANPNHANAWTYVTMVCIYCSIFAFSIGPANMGFILPPELWSQGPRPIAVSVSVQVYWWSMFFVNLTYPYLQSVFDAYMFAIFMMLMVYYTVFTYFLVPETKLRSFEDIVEQFRHTKKAMNTSKENVHDVIGMDSVNITSYSKTSIIKWE